MDIKITNSETLEVCGHFVFPKGQEYYAWETIKDFCKAYNGTSLIIVASYPEE